MSHFELTDETISTPSGAELFRIRATRDIPAQGVSEGDLGGFVEGAHSLDGDAWVSENARVFGDARVFGGAQVFDDAWVYGDARVFGDAWVHGKARVSGDAWVFGDARVSGDAWVSGQVAGAARVYGSAQVYGDARVFGDAVIQTNRDVLTLGPVGSENVHLTLFPTKNGAWVSAGCWDGPLEELMPEVQYRREEVWECTPQQAKTWVAEYEAFVALSNIRAAEWAGPKDM